MFSSAPRRAAPIPRGSPPTAAATGRTRSRPRLSRPARDSGARRAAPDGRARAGVARPAWPRIVAPIVLLAAVLAVVTLTVHAGLIGGQPKPAATHVTTKSSGVHTTKKYVYYRVRKGDTMSTIAAKYNISLSTLLALNPRASVSTLAIGQKLKVPNPRY